MSKNNFLIIDIGTTYLKYSLCDFDGLKNINRVKIVDFYSIISLIKDIISKNCQIEFISIASYSPALVFLDVNFDIVYITQWNDDNFVNVESSSFYIPRILWHNENKDIKYVMPFPEYFFFLLTDKIIANDGDRKYLWTLQELEKHGIDSSLLPPYGNHINFSKVSKTISGMHKISQNTIVINSGIDYISSQIGSGAIKDGYICNRVGTSEGVNYFTKNIKHIPDLLIQQNAIKDSFLISNIINYSGKIIDNFIYNFDIPNIDEFIDSIKSPDILGFKAKYIPITAPNYGGFSDFSNLLNYNFPKNYSKIDIFLNIIVNIFFDIRRTLNLYKQSDYKINKFIAVGKLSSNDNFNKIKSSAIGFEITTLKIYEAELMGGYLNILNIITGKKYEDLLENIVIDKVFKPDNEISDSSLFDCMYKSYIK